MGMFAPFGFKGKQQGNHPSTGVGGFPRQAQDCVSPDPSISGCGAAELTALLSGFSDSTARTSPERAGSVMVVIRMAPTICWGDANANAHGKKTTQVISPTACGALLVLAPPRSPRRTWWNPGKTLVKPWWNPGGTLVEPRWNPGGTQVEPRWNPGGTLVEPCWNPGGALVEPSWNLASGPPRSLSGLRPQSFPLLGEKNDTHIKTGQPAGCIGRLRPPPSSGSTRR